MRIKLWFALVGVTISSVATIAVIAGRGTSELREERVAAPEISVAAQRRSETGPVQMIRFVVFETGIYPRELTIGKGLVNFALEDRTHSAAALVVERVEGSQVSRVGEIHPTVSHSRGRGIIKLTPGRYELYEASRPTNRSVMTVKP